MKILNRFLGLMLLICACSTPPKQPEPIVVSKQAGIDYVQLQSRLGIELGMEETGFRDQQFDACDLGSNLDELKQPLSDCHHAFFTLIQVQLSCRQAEQPTAMLNESDLTSVRNQSLKWSIEKWSGTTATDFQGRAVIRTISGKALRNSLMRISNGVDFLVMRASQATAIVTPPSWCTE